MPGPHIYVKRITLGDVELLSGPGSPNGVVQAPRGSTWFRDDVAELWENTDGATAWTRVWPAAVADSTAIVGWGNNSVTSSTTTRYLTPWYDDSTAQTAPIQWVAPRAGTLRNLYVRHTNPAGNGNDIVYTVRVNGVPTLLSVTMASTDAEGSNLANQVVVAAGDLVDIQVTKGATVGTSPANIEATVEVA